MQKAPSNLRLIWADKIALWAAALAVALAAFAWGLVAIGAGAAGANHVLGSIGTNGAGDASALMLALWATLRALDFAFGGSTYKLFHAARVETPALATGKNLLAH